MGSRLFLKHQWKDPFLIKSLLSHKDQACYEKAKTIAKAYLEPLVDEAYEKESFQKDLLKTLGRQGLFGVQLGLKGAIGSGYLAYGLACRALEAIDSGFRSILSVQSGLAMQAIYYFGSDVQKKEYLEALQTGQKIAAFALTEPQGGSDPSVMQTRAIKKGKGVLLQGQKRWIGLADVADLILVWAQAEDGRVLGCLVDSPQKGLKVQKIKGKLSLRTLPSCDVFLEDVFVPETHILPLDQSLKAPLSCLSSARYGIAWGVMGAAEVSWHTARDYVLNRTLYGQKLAQKQLIQAKLAQAQSDIALGMLAAWRVGDLMNQKQASPETISLIKRHNCQKALDVTRVCRDMLGGEGILTHHAVIRHMINLETVNTYEGTHDIHSLILGRAQTGLSAF